MRLGKETVCVAAALVLCLLLVGCLGLQSTPLGAPLDARGILPKPRSSPIVPDLRISGDALAENTQIPLVPLPIPPSPGSSAPIVPVAYPKSPETPATAPGKAAPPLNDTPAVVGMENVHKVYKLAVERYDNIDSYIARLTRREQVRGENKPEEVMQFMFRKEPWSVYFKWVGPAGRGREAIFVKGQYDGKIHTKLAAGDMPLAPPGRRMALAPDSLLVRSASRHPITEAGFGASIERLGRVLGALDRGDERLGTLTDLGTIGRPEFSRPVAAIEHLVPPGLDPNLPRGGRFLYCFDPDSNLPVLLTTRDHTGQEVEYYFYDRLQFPVRLDDNDFNPDKVWGRPAARE